MRKLDSVHFDAHAQIKDIVGRGLINSDNVAIIELIKNSKDAGSKSVKVSFSHTKNAAASSRLIIQDSGQGMTIEDITGKWLNIAYSEKKYADGPRGNLYAGNKGIGRFSCDRLGKKLDLYTRKKGGEFIYIPIDWSRYETIEINKKVSDVPLTPYVISDKEFKDATGINDFNIGTVLVIKELHSSWGLEKLKNLRKELERFVIDPSKEFPIYLHADDFKGNKELNGKIENKIFDKLDFRTTSIHSSLDEKGKQIVTTLRHDGNDVFTVTEKNPYKHLRNIKASIYYLNTPAKSFFTKETGYRPVEFGSIFLFLNGFRIIPYGEPTNDWLSIDRRKQQGHSKYLGSRELLGRVEIIDKENVFAVSSSREGIRQDNASDELVSPEALIKPAEGGPKLYGFIPSLLRRLEKFVVDGLDWDNLTNESEKDYKENDPDSGKLEYLDRDKHILKVLGSVINSRGSKKSLTNVSFNKKYLLDLADKETTAYLDLVEDLKKKFSGLPVSQLNPVDKRDLSKFIERQAKELAARDETNRRLEKEAEDAQKETEAVKKTNEQLASENLFLRATSNDDLDAVINLHHQTILYADTVATAITNFRRKLDSSITKEKIIDFLDKVEMQNEKILKITRFATHANYKISSSKVEGELFTFIKHYLMDIVEYKMFDLKIVDDIPNELQLVKKFKPLELTMIIDNLVNNAQKAGASKVTFTASKRGKEYSILVSNNGKGLDESIKNPASIFDKGVTTTSGSGLGLFHVKKVVTEDLEGEVYVAGTDKSNFTIGVKLNEA